MSKRKMTPAQKAAARRTPEQKRALRDQQRAQRGEVDFDEYDEYDEDEEDDEDYAWDRDLATPEEQLTKRIFTLVEVVLLCFPFAVLGLTAEGGMSLDVTRFSDPSFLASMASNFIQMPIAGVVLLIQKLFYNRGEGGRAFGNLVVVLIAEVFLQNIVGIIAIAFLMWRVWGSIPGEMGEWRYHRTKMGMVADMLPGWAVLIVGLVYSFVIWQVL